MTAERSGDDVVVTVRDRVDTPGPRGAPTGEARNRDDGHGRAPDACFGLDSVRERLRLFHGERASLSFGAAASAEPDGGGRGVVAIVRLPIRPGAAGAAAP